MEHQGEKKLKGMVWCCVPSPGCHLTGVLGVHPFDSTRRELVPWCHSAMEFHLDSLVSALVPMPGLLCHRNFKGFPMCLLQCELSLLLPAFLTSLLPSRCCVLGWWHQPLEWGIKEMCSQNHTVHLGLVLGPGYSFFWSREIKDNKVNSYNFSAEGILPSQGHGL